jgi:hypothetical protein
MLIIIHELKDIKLFNTPACNTPIIIRPPPNKSVTAPINAPVNIRTIFEASIPPRGGIKESKRLALLGFLNIHPLRKES